MLFIANLRGRAGINYQIQILIKNKVFTKPNLKTSCNLRKFQIKIFILFKR